MTQILQDTGMTVLTTLLSILALFLLTKLMGAKQVSQMTMFDYVVGITIGSAAAELATELEEPHKPLTALIVYGLVAVSISVLCCKSLKIRAAVTGRPVVLLEDGVIYRENLKKAKLDLNEFLTYCRIGGWFDLSQLQTAVFEHNGALSILPAEPDRPATPRDLQLEPQQSTFLTEIIMEGRVLGENLRRMGKEEHWLKEQLKNQGYHSPKEIFLGLVDQNDQVTFYPPEKA